MQLLGVTIEEWTTIAAENHVKYINLEIFFTEDFHNQQLGNDDKKLHA